MKVQLGMRVRDVITGFEGRVTGRAEYITGCNQVLASPTVGEKGEHRDGHWFDEQRAEILDNGEAITLDNGATPGCDKPAPIR
ncbi:hypothetical protein [Mesorhizobium sp.]|uniref:hypothetical protein n=1 Tax=Mesorhizobium sp. TaxID=1871066 RepID=UPI0012021A16|nr:hypothetical protein [Mesorhizobium sp.]TIL34283.1 MAG: hypothetical protein E5Y85_11110 [Mesorhizobium sp.]TIM09169.1 MAG: hypothetical protein E5Y62_13515 [Mesorhizobium sp.]